MQRGGKIIGTAAMLSLAACGGEQGKHECFHMSGSQDSDDDELSATMSAAPGCTA